MSFRATGGFWGRPSSGKSPSGRSNEGRAATAEPVREEAVRLLVERCRSGEAAAFEELCDRYVDEVYAYALVAMGEHHEAEDVAQSVFMKAFESLPRFEFRSETALRVWFIRITRNTVMDMKRARGEGRVSIEEPEIIARQANGTDEDLAVALASIKNKDLDFLVERLPSGQREVILMRYFLGFTTEECATALGRSTRAIHHLHRRALDTLRQRLTALGYRRVRSKRIATERRVRPAPVIVARRFALRGVPLGSRSPAYSARAARYC